MDRTKLGHVSDTSSDTLRQRTPTKDTEVFEEIESVISAYSRRPARCGDYDPRAVEVARQIAAIIARYLPQPRVEHIGSTAVPGCAGTGIVDLMIPAADGEMENATQCLDRPGFQRQTSHEHFANDRPVLTGAWAYDGETLLLHVHVIPANAPEVDAVRFFRARLRAERT